MTLTFLFFLIHLISQPQGNLSINVIHTGLGTISPDGKQIIAAERKDGDPVHRVVKDRKSGRAVEVSDRGVGAEGNLSSDFPVWSHDSKWFAYEYRVDGGRQSEVRIASAEDGTIKIICRSEGRLVVRDWTPDGESILCRARKKDNSFSLVIVSVQTGEIQQLLSTGWDGIGHPRSSPDGKYVAFARESGKRSHIYVADLQGTQLNRLTDSSERESNPIWSADGEYVLYTSDKHLRAARFNNGQVDKEPILIRVDWGDDSEKRLTSSGDLMFRSYNLFYDVYTVQVSDRKVSAPTRVTRSRHAKAPAWSPDGRRIACFDRDRGLQIVSLDEGERESIDTGLSYITSVFWSPDGKTLALAPGAGTDPIGVSLYSLETRQLRPLVRFPRGRRNSQFSPKGFTTDGKQFVLYLFLAEDGTRKQNIAFDILTGKQQKVEFPGCPDRVFQYDISPDQTQIVYVADLLDSKTGKLSKTWKLVVSDLQFKNKTTLTQANEGVKWVTYPRWSPEGSKISYLYAAGGRGERGRGKQLRITAPDGSWQQTVDTGKKAHWWRHDIAPVWSPDGSKIALTLQEDAVVETSVLRNFLPHVNSSAKD